jgi:hypothetical protein
MHRTNVAPYSVEGGTRRVDFTVEDQNEFRRIMWEYNNAYKVPCSSHSNYTEINSVYTSKLFLEGNIRLLTLEVPQTNWTPKFVTQFT